MNEESQNKPSVPQSQPEGSAPIVPHSTPSNVVGQVELRAEPGGTAQNGYSPHSTRAEEK